MYTDTDAMLLFGFVLLAMTVVFGLLELFSRLGSLLVCCFVCGILGGLLGKVLLKKHYKKAGIV